jgi:hypothetical protein
MLIHLLVSVPRNDYLDEAMPDDEGIPGMPDDVGIPECPRRTFLHVRFPPNHHAFHHPLALPTITLSIIHWQSKTRASEPELYPA